MHESNIRWRFAALVCLQECSAAVGTWARDADQNLRGSHRYGTEIALVPCRSRARSGPSSRTLNALFPLPPPPFSVLLHGQGAHCRVGVQPVMTSGRVPTRSPLLSSHCYLMDQTGIALLQSM